MSSEAKIWQRANPKIAEVFGLVKSGQREITRTWGSMHVEVSRDLSKSFVDWSGVDNSVRYTLTFKNCDGEECVVVHKPIDWGHPQLRSPLDPIVAYQVRAPNKVEEHLREHVKPTDLTIIQVLQLLREFYYELCKYSWDHLSTHEKN